ncbi:MAG: diguanylate cyclase (GGDEF)-like protein [Alphaproteobacteria bacterium]|jgi:diguanylate cyclase (GGDEF)-like protein
MYVCEWEYKNVDIFQRISGGRFLTEAELTGADLCCIMIDFDHFKLVNDNFGHAVGDAVM